MKALFRTLVLTLATAMPAHAVDMDRELTFSIPSQPLASALVEFARQSQIQILTANAELTKYSSAGIQGRHTVRAALSAILSGTDLSFREVGEGTLTIAREGQGKIPATGATDISPARMQLAQEGGRDGARASAPEDRKAREPEQLEEIVVTAQKRTERLQDVPLAVSTVNADSLVDTNQLRLQDYYTQIPGLSVTTSSYGPPIVVVRGISSGGLGLNPTVGIVIDDVPLGASSRDVFGPEAPDVDPSDLARVELLRGPQGTLYGASSIGGLIKYVTVDPSMDRLGGKVQAGLNGIVNGDETGYSVRGSVNVPLGATFAIRASGFTRRDPGYVDDPVHGIEGVNRGSSSGGRLAFLWKPSERLSLKVSALTQDSKLHGSSEVNPAIGDLDQNKVPGSGGYTKKFGIYNATLTANLGSVDLTSVSGYSVADKSTSVYLPSFGGLTQTQFGVGSADFRNYVEAKKYTQEIRLSSSIGARADWLAGVYYNYEDNFLVQDLAAKNSGTGAIAGTWLHSDIPQTFSEAAAFANLTVHFTDRFDVQVGARESRIRQTIEFVKNGPYVPLFFAAPAPLVAPNTISNVDSFTYLVTPRLKWSPDLMMYARLASGFRPGGPNSNCVALTQPCEYKPDKANNFELGVKGTLFDRALSFDASLYYIDWKDIQILLTNLQVSLSSYGDNGGRARSQGMELSLEARPLPGMTLAAWAAYNDAVMTEAFPTGTQAYGVPGTRLPFSPRVSGHLSIDQEFPFFGTAVGFIGGSWSCVGDRMTGFAFNAAAAAVRQHFPSYSTVDLHVGAKIASWTTVLYANNVADERGVLYGGIGNLDPTSFSYIRPRMIGLSVEKAF